MKRLPALSPCARLRRSECGLSLIEVLVALVIISVGLLGIAKMQALAMASTRGASTRSLISIEAASLASAMHANRAYWNQVSTSTSNFNASVSNGVITASSDSNLTGATSNCAGASCSTVAMAAYDLTAWSVAINAVTPGSTGAVYCASLPVVCTITISWTENMVAANAAGAYQAGTSTSGSSQTQQMQYSLLVQPGN